MTKAPKIGPHIKAIRKQRGLTLDTLSERAGVSKSVLSELENSRGNPTFATLWSVANALEVNLSEITDEASEIVRPSLDVMKAHFTPEITSKDKGCTLRILGPTQLIGAFEWYEVSIAPKGSLISEPHNKGTWEHLTVTAGRFEVVSSHASAVIECGDTIRYPADVAHQIRNVEDIVSKGFLVVANK